LFVLQQPAGKRARLSKWYLLGDDKHYTPCDVPLLTKESIDATLPANATALDYLKLYVTDEIIDLVVKQTNTYADQYIASHPIKPHSSVQNWVKTDREEIFTFLGLCILMGIAYKPRIPMYWSTDAIFHSDIFSTVMSRDRFLLLLRFLHFADNTTVNASDPNRDKLWKLRQFTELVRERCKKVYTPGRDLCVDESLLLFKGRLGFKQYIKSKRARFGIKFFQLCTRSGIFLDFLIYSGDMTKELKMDGDFLISERIPITLIQPYLNKGHRLFLDNFYTSTRLAEFLLEQNTTMVGTVRPNRRNFPADLVATSVDRGESKFALSENGILAVKFRAKQDKANKKPKIVYLLSTAHKDEIAASSKPDKDGNPVLKPTCVLEYNKSMGGVDLMDQQLDSLLVIRKSYKWYKKVFFRVIMQCMLSAHKLMQLNGGQQDFLKFLHDAVPQLLTFAPRLHRHTSAPDSIARLTGRNHFPSKRKYEGTGTDRAAKSKKCRVCSAHGRRTPKGAAVETTWVCEVCPSVPGLCLETGCFRDYHTKFDYSQ